MVEGPNHVYICADCVSIAATVAKVNSGKSLAAELDPVEWRAAHMNFVCYVRVRQLPDGRWAATVRPGEIEADGATVQEAVRRAQGKVLASAADALAGGKDVGKHFSNHLDPALRECQF